MARRYQARPKPIILQKGDAGIRIILDSNGIEGDLNCAITHSCLSPAVFEWLPYPAGELRDR